MQTRLPGASKVARTFHCVASAVYDQTGTERPSGQRGVAIHDYVLIDVPKVGRDKALAKAPPEWRAACEVIDLDRLPDPATFAAEVAFVWDHVTDKGREAGRNIGRNYGSLTPTEYPGTADLVGLLGDDGVCVLDLKSGRLPPEEEQLMTLAVLATRTYKRKWARVGFVFVPEHGEPYSRQWDMDEIEIDAFADRLRDLALAISRARRGYAGERVYEDVAPPQVEPRATIGEHCRFCPSLAHCRPSQQMVRTFIASAPLGVTERIKAMTPEDKGRAWLVLDQVERIAEEARRVLKLEAELSPLPLPDGRVVQIGTGSRRTFDGDLVYRATATAYGPEVAEAAAPAARKATITSVKDALRSTGRGFAARADDLLASVEAEGGCRISTWPEAKIVRPALPAKGESA